VADESVPTAAQDLSIEVSQRQLAVAEPDGASLVWPSQASPAMPLAAVRRSARELSRSNAEIAVGALILTASRQLIARSLPLWARRFSPLW
jgi:hypothetical protein